MTFSSSGDWTIVDCAKVLWRRRSTLLWLTCAGALAATIAALAQGRVYQSRACIEVQIPNEYFLNRRSLYPAATPRTDAGLYVRTQADLLRDDALLEKIAHKLRLEARPEYQPRASVLRKLHQDIRIIPVKNTRVLQIVCDAREPWLAADLANTLADTYIDQSIQTWRRGARKTYEMLQAQREGLALQPIPRLRDAQRRAYQAIVEQTNNARIASAVDQSSIRLISRAEPASEPYKPNVRLSVWFALLGGLVAATGVVLLREQRRWTLSVTGDAARFVAERELGAIPKADRGSLHLETAVLEQPRSDVTESFRCVLTGILARMGNGPRVIAVTSAWSREGKTATASNLATALAGIGQKTLLIDGDVRHPTLHTIFGRPNHRGFSDLLSGGHVVESPALGMAVAPHLCLLPGGAPADIFSLLNSNRLPQLFEHLREQFEYVLVDTPACLESADARAIARHADGVVLVVRADHTDRRAVRSVVELLEGDGASITGIVLNQWNPL